MNVKVFATVFTDVFVGRHRYVTARAEVEAAMVEPGLPIFHSSNIFSGVEEAQ